MIDDLSRLLVAILYLSVFILRIFFLMAPVTLTSRNWVATTTLGVAALWTHFALLSYMFGASWVQWGSVPTFLPLRLVAAVVALGALAVLVATHWFLDDNFSPLSSATEDQTLVTVGPFRFVRHPMYASLVVMLLAIGVFSANWVVTGPTITAFVVGLSYRIPIEEAALAARFGWHYQDYKARTPMLVPLWR